MLCLLKSISVIGDYTPHPRMVLKCAVVPGTGTAIVWGGANLRYKSGCLRMEWNEKREAGAFSTILLKNVVTGNMGKMRNRKYMSFRFWNLYFS